MMKKFLVCLLMCVLLPVVGMAETSRITVMGKATVSLEPDQATLTASVVTQGESAATAAAENAEHVTGLLSALKAFGLQDDQFTTDSYQVSTVYDYTQGNARAVGYEVRNRITVHLTDMTQLGAVIDLCLTGGANEIGSILYASSRLGECEDEALHKAIEEGHRRAELAAEACGLKLGGVVSVTESYSSYTGARYAAEDSLYKNSTQIFASNLEVSASVEMVFQTEN